MNNPGHILLPTAYFPPVSYFVHLISNPVIYIEQMETFPRQTYRNRCEILTAAGKLNLIVPVYKPDGNHTLTRDAKISYREPWNHLHLKSVQTAYRSSPYYNYYEDIIQPLFELKETFLIDHNYRILNTINQIIGIQPELEFTKDYVKEADGFIDLRLNMKPGKMLHQFPLPVYPQVFSHIQGFKENLSILDLIFNTGPEAKKYLLKIEDRRLKKLG